MPIYEPAPNEVRLICDEMLDRYHMPLRDAKVEIDLLFAKAKADEFGDKSGAPLKLNGYPCAAIARSVSYKLRVQRHGDCEITIDGDAWYEFSEEEKRALIDHELEHFDLKLDKDGLVVRDDLDRPKITIRKHDHQFGWFDSIARRHGKASFEVQQAEAFIVGKLKQQWLPYMAEGFADIKPARAIPQTVRIAKEVTRESDGIAITLAVGDEHNVSMERGLVLAIVGSHSVELQPGDFDVIAWRDDESERPAAKASGETKLKIISNGKSVEMTPNEFVGAVANRLRGGLAGKRSKQTASV